MGAELVNINGKLINLTIVPIVGDGAYLFRSLSYLLYGTQERSMNIRKEIVGQVTNNCDGFVFMTHDCLANNYRTKEDYLLDMLQHSTYGSFCELVAAAQIYPFVFEVYRNGNLYFKFGTGDRPIKRLRFSHDLSNSHFDVYADSEVDKNTDVCPIAHKRRIELPISPTFTEPSPISNVQESHSPT